MAIDTMNIGQSIIESNIRTVTQAIHNHISNVQIAQSFSSHQPSHQTKSPHNYSQATNDEVDRHFVYAYDSSDGRLDMNGFFEKGDWVVRRTVEHLDYLTQSKDRHVLSEKKHLNFSFNLMNDESVSYLARFLHWQELNLLQLNLGYNRISNLGIESLFYNLRNDFDVRTHQIQLMNLSNNNIGDYGSNYISQSLVSGRYPNLRSLDVSGNPITEKSYVHFAESFKSDVVKEIVVILKIANTLPEIKEFFSKGFKYYINQIDQYVSNFSTNKIRSNMEVDKWKECKELGVNVGNSVIDGFVKGGIILKSIPGALFLAGKEAVIDNLLTPEALYCYIDTRELVGEVFDQNCTIF
ncbi:Putative leucine-rich repeats protein [Candidatus Trichorickettsia mobilis]|uniref:Leucine-rich repeats protein n=1 Tax=Candidatus Trichorickettsia mobilis TaxID=1346319 RepID=A0ABZ0UU97_9RICK|nr:hypothetical protein [Candidatus Trichorickettsia mobilis]WPY00202.1 Putative leucine-rich repeats protein [Candidatus Trichorickettsia mobilis]